MSNEIVIVINESPFPTRGGDALRYSQMCSVLQSLGFDVHYIFMWKRHELSDAAEAAALAGAGATASYLSDGPIPERDGAASTIYRKLTYYLGSTQHPLACRSERFHPEEQIVRILQQRNPAVLILQSIFAHYLPAIREAYRGPVVLDCNNADVHLAEQSVLAASGLRKLAPRADVQAARRVCQRFFNMADEIWAVSEDDAERTREYASKVPIVVFRNGMDRTVATRGEAGVDDQVLSVANYGYGPNRRGLEWFMGHIWPQIRQLRPSARFLVAGAKLPAELKAKFSSVDGVEILGFVDDLTPLYKQASLVVVPLLEGAGTRLKIVEAWQHGKALVSTTKGIEGIPAPPSVASVRDTPEEFAAEVASLLGDRTRRKMLGENALNCMEQLFTTVAISGVLRKKSLIGELCKTTVFAHQR